MRPTVFLLLLVFSLLAAHAAGQDSISAGRTAETVIADSCSQQDIFDVLTRKKLKAPEIPTRKARAIILPLVAYTPVTRFQFGIGSSFSWTFGKHPSTNLSAGSFQVLWTTEKQLISYLITTMFFSRNRWCLQTDWRWYIYRMATYGLGTDPKDYDPNLPVEPGNEDNYDNHGRFPMEYNWIRLHNVLYRAMANGIYAGFGYHLDHYYDINDLILSLDSTNMIITPHYEYSRLHGFNPDSYTTSGLSVNFAYDTRDNIINAYKGIYVNVNYLYNMKMLGSSKNGSRLWTEFRTYIGLSRRMPRHVLAFWYFGDFHISGDIPYLNLMANGFDAGNSSGRGYTQGRWRGDGYVYGEVEYRFPISTCSKIVGGVLFANVSTASSRDNHVPLFGFFKAGCGFGVRIMVGKHDRTNLLIDFGLGELSQGFYLKAQETF